jgi:pimeloyl-ACP methyl ester carboxylesterase
MPAIERTGGRVYYEVDGEGPPVLLGHSLLCDGRMWEGVVPRLASRYRVINIDARGHRNSTADGPFDLYDLADDWLAIMAQEGIDRAALCGLSMGGMTAMRVALKSPGKVSALALLDTSAEAEVFGARVQYFLMAAALRAFGHLDVLYRQLGPIMFSRAAARDQPEVVAREVARMREKEPRGLYYATQAVISRDPLLERLRRISCPTLVLVGDDDKPTPPFRSERIARVVPGARLERVPASGHLSALEAPDVVADHLLAFLESTAQ